MMFDRLKNLFLLCHSDRQELLGLRRSMIAMGLNPAKVAEFGNSANGNIEGTLVLASFQSSAEHFERHGFSGDDLIKLESLVSSLELTREDYAKFDSLYDKNTHDKIRDLLLKSNRSTLAKLAFEAMRGDS